MSRSTRLFVASLLGAAILATAALPILAQETPGPDGPSPRAGSPTPLAAAAAELGAPDGNHSHLELEGLVMDLADLAEAQATILESLTRRIVALETQAPPEPPPPPSPVGTLALGPGAVPLPAPVDVAGLPVLPITDDRRTQLLVIGTGSVALNYYDPVGTPAGAPVPRHIELSLNGGEWVATRSGAVKVPEDLPDGSYQLRIVVFPPEGMSLPQPIRTVTRATVGGITFWDYR